MDVGQCNDAYSAIQIAVALSRVHRAGARGKSPFATDEAKDGKASIDLGMSQIEIALLIGASRPEQIIENVGALKNLSFSAEELAEIDRFAQEGGINLWEKPSTAE